MQYRKMPGTEEELSILGFGCMRLPLLEGRIDEERATAQLRGAIDAGVNYLDTAWPYHGGESEAFLGRALAGGYREKVRIATKLPSWMVGSREEMDEYLGAQLKALRTDRIDYYLLHNLDGGMWDRLAGFGVADFLDRALADGRIGAAGFSFHGPVADFKRIVDAYPWRLCQIQYNILDVENQAGREGLLYAADRGLGVIIMEPLRGGNLAIPEPPPRVAEVWDSAEVRRTPAEWGLRWIWNHPEVTVVLSGMNEEAHVEENLRVADDARANAFSPEELALVDRVRETYAEIMKVPCTGCGYCLPCPAGVAIPGCFEMYNQLHMFGNPAAAKFTHAIRMSGMLREGEPSYASRCVGCGECLEKCPQAIEIPDFLEKVAEELEGDWLAETEALARKKLNIT